MNANEEFIQEFLVECEENLDQLDQDLVALEETPHDQGRLASIFRTIHTIKGTSGFFGYAKLGAITHAGENLLGRLRDGELVLTAEIANALLKLVDKVREILAAIEQHQNEGASDTSPLIGELELLAAQPSVSFQGEGPETHRTTPQVDQTERVGAELASASIGELGGEGLNRDEQESGSGERGESEPPEQVDAKSAVSQEPAIAGAVQQQERIDEGSSESGKSVAPSAAAAGEEESADASDARRPATAQGTVRVDVGLLNDLMNQVGELVLARNQIRPFSEAIEDRVFGNALQQLDLITSDLQEGIMKTRMQPIGHLWARLPRVVRDLAQAKGKQVQLEMQGRETELDRTLLEAIKDPLTHLVRNAVDHGIELSETRRRLGKPEVGTVSLKAFHEGGLVNIEISDDGGGIDPELIREKARRQGLITSEQSRQMSAKQVTQLIFMPGLSTAERVTDTSGRGVGMDVVKTNIERIGGSVTIDSQPGVGTTLRVKIPLTLAIIPVLMVRVGRERYAIPQVSLREIITLFEGVESESIETIGGAQVLRLRGELLPLIDLAKVLRTGAESEQESDSFLHLVVLEAIGQRFALVIGQIARSEEIVVKPLHKTLAQIPAFSGATVLGDGQVALILDVAGVARMAGVERCEDVGFHELEDEGDAWESLVSEHGDLLVCEAVPGHHVAVPLDDVARLEEFPQREVQQTNGQGVVPYRGQLMPLLQFDGYQPQADAIEPVVHVVVHRVADRYIGMLMTRILDVLPAMNAIDTSRKRSGQRGRVLVDGRVLEVVDIAALAHGAGIDLTTRPPEVES